MLYCVIVWLTETPLARWYINDSLFLSECAPEKDGYGYSVTITGVTVGSTATYTCWPGFDHVSGDTSRQCLLSLIWSGQRPTCQRACITIYPLYCRNCRFNWNSLVHKCQYRSPITMPSQNCTALIQEQNVISVYYALGKCSTSDCDIYIDDLGDSSEWTFTHSCFDCEYPLVLFGKNE